MVDTQSQLIRDVARALRRAAPWTTSEGSSPIAIAAPAHGLGRGLITITGARGGRLGFELERADQSKLVMDVAADEPFFGRAVGHLARPAAPNEINLLVDVAAALVGVDRGVILTRTAPARPSPSPWTAVRDVVRAKLLEAMREGRDPREAIHQEELDYVRAHQVYLHPLQGATDDERSWLAAQDDARTGIWEVMRVDTLVTLREVFTHEQLQVAASMLPRAITETDHLLARLVPIDGEVIVDGLHSDVTEAWAARLKCQVVGDVRRWSLRKPVPRQKLAASDVWIYLLAAWSDEPPKELRGVEPTIRIEQRFAVGADRDALVQAIGRIAGVAPHGPDLWTYVDARHRAPVQPGRFATHASLLLDARGLEIVAFTRAHADRIVRLLRAHAGPLLGPSRRDEGEGMPLRTGGPRPEGPFELPSLGAQRAMRAMKERHYAIWSETRLPQLADRSPRRALRTKRGRDAVERILEALEHHEAQELPDSRYDVGLLRRALGLA